MPLSPGEKLAAYEIISALGAGGMGEVYRARDTRLGREVALKILPPDVTNEPGRLERFDREARAIAALNHPHIVTIYSTEEADGVRFLTMELVDGPTLSDLVTSSGMAIPKFLEIAIPLADALAAAHQKHITHRDLKPGNVMISSDGRVKVLDFGLARVGGGDIGEHSLAATAAPITHQGMIVGTMPYMSPEQVEGREIGPRSDLFSLGVIFYELLTGKRPFSGGSSPALMSAILRDTPPPITATRADLPDGLERLVDRLIEKRPEDRVQTARDVFNELKHLRKQLESGNVRSSSVGGGAAAPPHNLWIAVLPFSVRGADHDAAELAVGLTDDIAASLARFPVFNVVAAQSTRAYKDSALDVRQIADRLGARYVITGNVRTSARVVRTTAQLIDASSGAQLWSESYDRDATAMDLFAIQDDLTDHIVATIGDQTGVLVRSMLRSVRTQVPASEQTSRELLLRAWGLLQNPLPADHAELRAAIETRLTVEADNADLWAELAHIYLDEHILALNVLPDALGRAAGAARHSVAIDPNNQSGWNEVAGACFFMRDAAGLFDAAERAVAINPRNAHSLGWMGNLYTHAGEYERGSKLSERAMAINPRHGGWMHFGVFNKHFAAGNYTDALQAARRVNIPQLNWNYFAIATAAAHLDLSEEARLAVEKMIQVTPELAEPQTVREFTERWYWKPEMVDALVDGIHKARSHPTPGSGQRPAARPPSSTSGSPRSGELSVAVLPFVPRSSDDESKALADGLTDDITSGLSRFGYLHVLSRSISERLAREHTQLNTHARYTLEGNVRKSGTQVRIGITLVDTQAGTNLWTQNYDRDAGGGVFSLQDDVASAAVAVIGDQTGVLVRAMAASMAERPVDELSVAELVIRYHLYAEAFRPEEHLQLRDAFERALEKEPRAAEGWACLALLNEHEHGFGLNRKPDAPERHRRAAERAVELDPRSQQAWIALASVHRFARDREGLKGAVERVVSLNPLNADLVALGGLFLSMAGEYDRAHALVSSAMARKPHHAGWYHFPMCHYFIARGDYESALREIKAVNMPMMPLSHLAAAAISGHIGRTTEARAAFAGLRAINPGLAEPAGAKAFWSMWLWDDAFIETLFDGFKRATELADDRSGARSDVRSGIRSDDRSIAVLPFADLSEKKDQDWFCDGIAEEVLNALAQLPGLRVAARASAFSFRGKADDLEAIGEKLNVSTVLEGSVRRAGDRVRITAQLSDVRQGQQLWSERFDRELKDIFDVQEEIARAIADRLRISIGGGARLVEQVTTNLDAYVQLLKGREFVTRRGRAILDAIPCFEHALELDPNLAEAHALLADCYRLLGLYGIARASEVMPKAQASIDRAMAIDPNQPEAMATTAIIAAVYEWNIAEVRRRSDRALAVDPNHVRALAERSISIACLEPAGTEWHQEVVEHIARARGLDPLSAWVMAIESQCQMLIGRVAESVQTAKRAIDLDDKNFTAHWMHVCALSAAGREDEALEAAVPALAMSGRHPMILSSIAAIHSGRGEVAPAEAIFNELIERSRTGFIGSAALGLVAASAERWPEARDYLAKATAEHDPYVVFWKLPAFKPIWKDDQCAATLKATSLFHRTSA